MVAEIAPIPETDELWRLTMEHSPVGMAIVSPTGGFVTANLALCEMLGHEADVLITKSFQDITHPADLDADVRLFEQTLAGEISSYRITKRYLRADGSTLVGDLSVALLRDPMGTPIHFISQIVDLSERQAFVDVERSLGAAAHQLVHVGDSYGADVRGALAAGWRAVHIGPQAHAGARTSDNRYRWAPDLSSLLDLLDIPVEPHDTGRYGG